MTDQERQCLDLLFEMNEFGGRGLVAEFLELGDAFLRMKMREFEDDKPMPRFTIVK